MYPSDLRLSILFKKGDSGRLLCEDEEDVVLRVVLIRRFPCRGVDVRGVEIVLAGVKISGLGCHFPPAAGPSREEGRL